MYGGLVQHLVRQYMAAQLFVTMKQQYKHITQ